MNSISVKMDITCVKIDAQFKIVYAYWVVDADAFVL